MSGELRLYTAAEVADLLRMNHQVIQRKLQAGEIPGYRIGREWRVEHDQLVGWLDTHSNQRAANRDGTAPFFDRDGHLTSIPASRKKRDAVLARLAAEFEPQRAYKEAEVNAILRRFHDDVAYLRRELIATKHLVRTRDGIYKKASAR